MEENTITQEKKLEENTITNEEKEELGSALGIWREERHSIEEEDTHVAAKEKTPVKLKLDFASFVSTNYSSQSSSEIANSTLVALIVLELSDGKPSTPKHIFLVLTATRLDIR